MMKNTQLPGLKVKSVEALQDKLRKCMSKHMPRNLCVHTALSSSNPQWGQSQVWTSPKGCLDEAQGGVTGAPGWGGGSTGLKGKGKQGSVLVFPLLQ